MGVPKESACESGRLVALRELAATYNGPLARYFSRRTTQSHEVPDLVQEVFLRLSRMDDPEEIRDRNSYIFVTAANVLRDWARRSRTRINHGTAPSDDVDIECSAFWPDRVLEGKQTAECIRQALSELPERTRDVFVLRMLEGWKMADVARSLDISTRAAEKHQARALAHVAACLGAMERD